MLFLLHTYYSSEMSQQPLIKKFSFNQSQKLCAKNKQRNKQKKTSVLQETQNIKTMLVHNVKRALEVLNSLPGFCCQPVEGGAFAFPRLYLPPEAIQKAKVTILSHKVKYTLLSQSIRSLKKKDVYLVYRVS